MFRSDAAVGAGLHLPLCVLFTLCGTYEFKEVCPRGCMTVKLQRCNAAKIPLNVYHVAHATLHVVVEA